jgi:hypothetical protein
MAVTKREAWQTNKYPTASNDLDANDFFLVVKIDDTSDDATGTIKRIAPAKIIAVLTALGLGGGGGSSIKQTTIDFGSVPVKNKFFTISEVGCLPTSKIIVLPGPSDEWDMDPAVFIPIPGTDQFICNVAIQTPIGIVGTRTINYLRT